MSPSEDTPEFTSRRDYRSRQARGRARSRPEASSSATPGTSHDDVHDEHHDDVHYDDVHYDDAHHDDVHYDDAHHDDVHYDDAHHDDVHYDDDHHYDTHEILGAHAEPAHRERRARRSPVVRWTAILAALAVVVVGGYLAVQAVSGLIPSFSLGSDTAEDYAGPGSGEVTVQVPEGAGGGQIGQILAEADVVASAAAFSNVAVADPRANSLQPGTYSMLQQMSAADALERMLDPANRVVSGVTVREGLWKDEVFDLLAEATETDRDDYEDVDASDLDLPEAAGDNMEGYLFPDTYQFPPDATAEQQLQAMVDLGTQRFAEVGLEDEEMEEVVIKASLIQAEAAFADDLPKVAQVIENRLEEGMPLGFDSTIHFMFQERGRAGTTDAQRGTEDPYNTYLNTGLPPGPVNSPGLDAIEAAMNPEEGPWLYFATVDPTTGETNFAETFEEHQENVRLFNQWCRDNPDDC
ncbi:endolytic transglycosylase MltG [Ornithinimicrobium sediminis]|uniref:endolytic transglycosylase MltG n=1 Tax=Ornithinimicrobium sediminis TaxID=2904603 RepID=UPI001E567A22|nr:endolytic transglycosylase MltG [Ornithinimicrobium sediminis]MCE0488356.1 endolytic transglycosylase MltG [Ornithinimicrobium sediminis]